MTVERGRGVSGTARAREERQALGGAPSVDLDTFRTFFNEEVGPALGQTNHRLLPTDVAVDGAGGDPEQPGNLSNTQARAQLAPLDRT